MTIKQTGFQKDLKGTYILKDPQAALQYGIDWKDWLNSADTLSTANWTVETTSTNQLTATDGSILDGVALITLNAGSTSTVYTVACKILTSSGYTDVRRFRVLVEPRYIP
jgi:hypothetical protein